MMLMGFDVSVGFDDDRGDYTVVLHDHIAYRYEILMMLGKGSFGQVVKCYDYKTNQHVALKIIRNKKRFHHQALVEVKILEHIRTHVRGGRGRGGGAAPCVVSLRDPG